MPTGIANTTARTPCHRLPGRTRSLIAKPSVAKTRNGITMREMTPGQDGKTLGRGPGNDMCFQLSRKPKPKSARLKHARSNDVVSFFTRTSLFSQHFLRQPIFVVPSVLRAAGIALAVAVVVVGVAAARGRGQLVRRIVVVLAHTE